MISEMFSKAYAGSWYTITGCGGDINDWKKGYTDMLNKENIGTPKEWFEFTGKDMNEEYELTGRNAYANDLHFLAFGLDDLNIDKLAMFKLAMGDRWFDDIVENNRFYQKKYGEEEGE